MLTLFRRHLNACPHSSRRYRRCSCPIHVEGSLRGEKIRKALDMTSWEAAENLIAAWNAAGEIGVIRVDVPTIAEAVEKFLADAASRQLKEPSLKKYRNLLNKKLLPFCAGKGWTRLAQLNVEALREFRSSWTFSPVTHEKSLGFLKAFFRFCETAGWLKSNPTASLKPPRFKPVPTLPFSEEEIRKLLGACSTYNGNGNRLRAVILLLLYSGLRIGDAVALRRDRLNGSTLTLYTQKSGTHVRVPLPPKTIAALRKLPGKQYFFWSGNGKLKSAIEDCRRSFAGLATQAKVDNAHFHRFRDCFAISLLEKGVPIEDVAVLLGHQSSVVTRRHYNAWIKSRQEHLEATVRKTW